MAVNFSDWGRRTEFDGVWEQNSLDNVGLRESREKSGLGCLILKWVFTGLSSRGWDQISLFFGDGSDNHCKFLWNVITSLPNCVSSDCSHNVHYCMNLKSVMENFVLHKMFQLQKADASRTVCMSCDFLIVLTGSPSALHNSSPFAVFDA